MGIISNFRNLFTSKTPAVAFATGFVFPYSADPLVKRQQLIDNLQHGILFEDTGVFIPWNMSFKDIDRIAEQRRVSGDRTNWFLGQHTIMDGYVSLVGVMKWLFVKDTAPFSQINEFLGEDYAGCRKFILLKDRFMEMFGEPNVNDPEMFGDLDIGVYQWDLNKINITLVGIEQFSCKYRLHIGLKER